MLKALIVDEEVDTWFMLSGILRQNHIKTSFVNTLSAARQALQTENPGFLFFDNHVQDNNLKGNFIKYVKSHYPKTKIVMVKDQDTGSVRTRTAVTEEPDLFISKPFNTEIFNAAIQSLL